MKVWGQRDKLFRNRLTESHPFLSDGESWTAQFKILFFDLRENKKDGIDIQRIKLNVDQG